MQEGEIQIPLWMQQKGYLTLCHSHHRLALYHYISATLLPHSYFLSSTGDLGASGNLPQISFIQFLAVMNQLSLVLLSSVSLLRYKEGRSPVHCTLQLEGSAATSFTPWAALGMGRSSFALQEFPCLWHFPTSRLLLLLLMLPCSQQVWNKFQCS